MQGFIDEIAVAAGKDPLQYRIDLLNSPAGGGPAGGFNPARARGVLEAVRDMSAGIAAASCRKAPAWAWPSSSRTPATWPTSSRPP
jgi:hypothetical protein